VHQPYAHAICTGLKAVENRTWTTSYRGLVLIHAGKSRSDLRHRDKRIPKELYAAIEPAHFGAFIGAAILQGVADVGRLSVSHAVFQKAYDTDPEFYTRLCEDPFMDGPQCLVFGDALLLDHPVPFKANVGLRVVPNIEKILHPRDVARILKKLL
jgi:hypothetical protein